MANGGREREEIESENKTQRAYRSRPEPRGLTVEVKSSLGFLKIIIIVEELL